MSLIKKTRNVLIASGLALFVGGCVEEMIINPEQDKPKSEQTQNQTYQNERIDYFNPMYIGFGFVVAGVFLNISYIGRN